MFKNGKTQIIPLLDSPTGKDATEPLTEKGEASANATSEEKSGPANTGSAGAIVSTENKTEGASSLDSTSEEKMENGPPAYLKSTEVFDGTMLRNERTPIEDMETKTDAATAVTDEAFIPLAFAEETIESLTKKLMQIRSKHHAILGQVDEAYAAKAKATQEHYTQYINKLKKTAAEKIMHYKHVIQEERQRFADAKAATKTAFAALHARYEAEKEVAEKNAADAAAQHQLDADKAKELEKLVNDFKEKETTFNATIAILTEEKDKLVKDVEYKGTQIEGQKMVLTGLLNEAARQLQTVETEKIELEKAKESASQIKVPRESLSPKASVTEPGSPKASVTEPAPAEPESKKFEQLLPSMPKATPEKEAKEVLAEHDEVKKQVEEAAGTPDGLKAGVDEHYEKLKASHESLKTENSQLTRRVKKLKAQIATLEESAAAAAKLAAEQLAAKTKDLEPEPAKEQSPEEAKKPEPESEPTKDPAPEEAKKPEPEPTKEQAPAAAATVAAATVSVGISEAEKEKYQQQMHALEKQNKKLTEKLKAAKSEVKELLAAKGENTSLQQRLEVAVAEAEGLRKRLAVREEAPATGEADGEDVRLRSEITLLEKELTEARAQLKDTHAEMSAAKLEYNKRELALNDKVEKLQTELASQKSAVVAVAPVKDEADTEALENELAAAKKHVKHEKKKVKILKGKITAAHHERDELQKKLEAFEKEKAAKLEATASEMNNAQVELAATKEQIKTLSAETEALKARLEARSAEGGESEEIKILELQLTKLRASMSKQADSIQEMQKKSVDEITKMQHKNRELKKSLAEAQAEAQAAAKAAKAAKEGPAPVEKPSAPQVDPEETKALRLQLTSITSERDTLNEEVTKLKAMINTSAEDKAKMAQVTAKVAKLMQQTLNSTAEMVKAKRHAALKAAYTKVITEAVAQLKDVAPELAKSLSSDLKNASRGRNLPRVSMLLRSALEDFVDEHGDGTDAGASSAEFEALKQQLELKQQEAESLEKKLATAKKMVESAGKASIKQLEKEKKQEQKKVKELNVKVKQLQSALEKAKKESDSAAASKAAAEAEKSFNKKLAAQQKQQAKKIEALTAENDAQVKKIQAQSKKLTKELEATNTQLEDVTAEMKKFKKLAAGSKAMEKQVEELQGQVVELKTAKKQAKHAVAEMEKLNKLYKQEQILRKRYWNMMEDMKGKIRVYARCRPFAKYEIDRGCKKVVSFADDVTILLKTEKFGDKEFVYDQCFSPESTNEQVFEDTKRLVHSAIDGFNVCVFAYGQTGSGKTYTVVGNDASPGLIPRGIGELFKLIKENTNSEATVSSYMIELYNDVLVDLFYMARHEGDPKAKTKAPKLDVKKDSKGMVHIKGAVIEKINSPEEGMALFYKGNGVRHVGSTKMNAESSRSHLIFAIMIDNYDKQTKKTSHGKFSFIDLAGSERVGKTGANAARLREAKAINKSLSALGNVISALSVPNASHIPYRDNKLTLVMSDSLGGNAKTLMFVNISPADYNCEETQTSLVYASRVKLITNQAKASADTAEVTRLKKVIRNLRNGLPEDHGMEDAGEEAAAAAPAKEEPAKEEKKKRRHKRNK